MSIQQRFKQELNRCAASGSGPHHLDIAEGNQRLVCDLTELDRFGCACDELRLETPALAGVSLEELSARSAALAARLTYLLEPISPVEADGESCTVQLRSNPPQRDDDGTQYYELLMRRGGSISLQRWQSQPGSPRAAIAAELTREVLVRLVGDFADSI
jgi:hypothetical protein